MQRGAFVLLALFLGARPVSAFQAVRLENVSDSPLAKVVVLLTDLQGKIQQDGAAELKSYDKFACWCEDTLGRKASDIATGKDSITDLEALIVKLGGEIGAHTAEIAQLKKDIAQSEAATKEALQMREKEHAEYTDTRSESEQCIGALEAAIKVLQGAGTGKKGFLETIQEVQLLGAVAGIKSLLKRSEVAQSMSDDDLDAVKQFVEKPQDFVGARGSTLSAAQVTNNPFGDYAPQSSRIQGILKGMYDSFTSDLEKSNAQEAEQEKGYQALMSTKAQELATLHATHEKQVYDEAQKKKSEADNHQLLDDTKAQLNADEDFFTTTKAACKEKAGAWAERSRLRTEELHGISKGIQLLDSAEARAMWAPRPPSSPPPTLSAPPSSTNMTDGSPAPAPVFLQVDATGAGTESASHARIRTTVFEKLRAVASRYQSVSIAGVAADLKTGGHFDVVITAIDKIIAVLREEEQADIAHRDRCQNAQSANENAIEDLDHDITKSGNVIQRMADQATQLQAKIAAMDGEILATQQSLSDLLWLRNDERTEFEIGLQDDQTAVEMLEQALGFLSAFYTKHNIPLAAVQTDRHQRQGASSPAPAAPEFAVNPDQAPETSWDRPLYSAYGSENSGILAIIGMIKQDLENEMQTAQAADAEAQANYVKNRAGLEASLETQTASKATLESELAALQGTKLDEASFMQGKSDDKDAELKLKSSIYLDCSWVDQYFDSRATKRKAETDGLQEAKAYLAGVDSGTELSFS